MTQEIYCFWLVPEKSAFVDLKQLITGLATDYGAVEFEPHLTLSIVPTTDLDDPEAALRSLVSQSKSLTLNSPKVTTGEIFTQSVYLRFEDSKELTNLHALSCAALKIQQPVLLV